MKQNCIIVGAGTYGQVYAEYLKEEYNVIGFIDDDISLDNKTINGIKVLGNFAFLLHNIDKGTNVFIPIGNNKIRCKLLNEVIKAGFKTPTYIHKNTVIHSSVLIGQSVYILPGTTIMPLTKVNDYTMISVGVNIAHHVSIQKGCFFSQGSNIGASIKILQNVFCGIGATIMTGVKEVGNNSIIGAGAVIIRNVPDGATVVGNPGKVIKMTKF